MSKESKFPICNDINNDNNYTSDNVYYHHSATDSVQPAHLMNAEQGKVVNYAPFVRSSKHRAIIEQISSKCIQNTTCTTCAL